MAPSGAVHGQTYCQFDGEATRIIKINRAVIPGETMEIKFGKQALKVISAAAERKGLSVEDYVIDAALRSSGARGAELDQQDLLRFVEEAKSMAFALPMDRTFRLIDLVEGQAWWDDLPAVSRQQMNTLFRQALQVQPGFIEFTSRDPENKTIYMRVA